MTRKVYWTILTYFLGNIKSTLYFQYLQVARKITIIIDKASLFNDFLASRCVTLKLLAHFLVF